MRKIDVNKTVYELTEQYPELIDLLAKIGFLGIKNQILRNTLGKVTTLKEGCKKQGKDIKEVIEILKREGYEVTGE